MYPYHGDFPTSATVYLYFHTFNAAGASVTISSFTLAEVRIYKNGSITQRASTAGIVLLDTDGVNFDGITGIHGISIDTSNNTDAGFYVAGAEYLVAVISATVDAQVVNFILGSFSLERTGGVLALLKGANGLSAIKSETGSIQTDTNDLQARLPAALVSGRIDASVGANAAGAITSAAFAAGAINAAALAADAITAAKVAADVTTEIQTGLATAAALTTLSGKVDVVDDFLDTEIAAIKVQTDRFAGMIELDGAVYRFTTNAVEQAPGGSGTGDILASGTAQSGTLNSIRLAASESTTVNRFRFSGVRIKSGTGFGQSRQILAYNVTRDATVSEAWDITPDNTSGYEIYSLGVDAVEVDALVTSFYSAQRSAHQVAGSFGEGFPADVLKVNGNATAAAGLVTAYTGAAFVATGWTIPWNAAWDAEVQSEAADALVAFAPATTAALAALEAKVDVVDNFLDTEIADISSRLPAALSGGFMSASVDAGLGVSWQLAGVGNKDIGPAV